MPAVSIALEGASMEVGQLLFGSNVLGIIVGGALAMLYILIHIFVRLLIVYGINIYILYEKFFEELVSFAGLKNITPIGGLIILAVVHLVWGIAVSF